MSLWALGIEPTADPSTVASPAPVGPGEAGGRDLLPLTPPAAPVGQILLGRSGAGSGATYRPHPALPPAEHLDYMDKFVRALVVVVLLVYVVRDPGRVVRAFKRRAGVE